MKATKEDVERFLSDFHTKMKVFDIIFRDDRGKNVETLALLEITPVYRVTVVGALEVKDYVDGPILDTLNENGDMWVFGKDVKDREVYIKISIGRTDRPTICISFHLAEHELNYPYQL